VTILGMDETQAQCETAESSGPNGARNTESCHTFAPVRAVFGAAAEVAERRAGRLANTFPLLAALGANALSGEIRMRAEDHEKILRVAGIRYTSPLRAVADRVPEIARRGAEAAVNGEMRIAGLLRKVADRLAR